MNDDNAADFDATEPPLDTPPRPGGARRWNDEPSSPQRRDAGPANTSRFDKKRRFDIDPVTLLGTLLRRWRTILASALGLAAVGLLLALHVWELKHIASATLGRSDPSAISELVRPQELATPTLIDMVQTQAILQKAGARLDPALSAGEVAARLDVTASRSTDLTTVAVTDENPEVAAALANAFSEEAIRFTKDLQSAEAIEAEVYVRKQLEETEADLTEQRESLPDTIPEDVIAAIVSPAPAVLDGKHAEKLRAARDELDTLLLRYTEAHPLVREQRARLAALSDQATAAAAKAAQAAAPQAPAAGIAATPVPAARPGSGSSTLDEVMLDRLRSLENNRAEFVTRKRLLNLFKDSPPGYFRIMQEATPADARAHRPWLKIAIVAVFFGFVGFVAASGFLLVRELFDNRLKTISDVKRVTRLPLLATLGDLQRMSDADQKAWAFRTWIALQSRLSRSPNCGLVCGVTSALAGDGRSTWIRLLGQAASRCGFRVLTIATTPTGDIIKGAGDGTYVVETSEPPPTDPADGSPSTAITTSVLSTAEEVALRLTDTDSRPMVHIPLPGWVWNLERRKQWQEALDLWRKIDNIVILIELPPASVPESVLLSENLPNLIWLSESGRSDAEETRSQLETLRHARGNLVGSVLNRAPDTLLNGRLARWFACGALVFTALGTTPTPLSAQELHDIPPPVTDVSANEIPVAPIIPATPGTATTPAVAVTPAFSVGAATPRAAWQQRLTLGPGDVLNLGLFGAPELTREEIPVGPDGRISYLEAQSVPAAGLTVDEFRERLAEELAKYRRAPQPIVIPVAYRSKKYFVLGKVVQKGVFTLDRPITIIEAVARARGLETGLSDRNLIELADLSRAFLARGGNRMPVNFEQLFRSGDLTQNIPLEPGDYLYFPAGDQKEVYVLGEVGQPGPLTFGSDTGALAAVAARGGFTDRAWKKRLLVVRGSLNQPELFIVNASDVLAAKSPDFKLQPKDIVYVNHRPWIRAEELLDLAATAFVQAAVVTWTGENVSRE